MASAVLVAADVCWRAVRRAIPHPHDQLLECFVMDDRLEPVIVQPLVEQSGSDHDTAHADNLPPPQDGTSGRCSSLPSSPGSQSMLGRVRLRDLAPASRIPRRRQTCRRRRVPAAIGATAAVSWPRHELRPDTRSRAGGGLFQRNRWPWNRRSRAGQGLRRRDRPSRAGHPTSRATGHPGRPPAFRPSIQPSQPSSPAAPGSARSRLRRFPPSATSIPSIIPVERRQLILCFSRSERPWCGDLAALSGEQPPERRSPVSKFHESNAPKNRRVPGVEALEGRASERADA